MRVMELETDVEFIEAFPVVRDLRTHLTQEDYMQRITLMRREDYRMVVLRDDEDLVVCAAGFKVFMTLYAGKVLHVYDLVTADTARGEGYGKAMMEHLYGYAKSTGCDAVTLNSGFGRTGAHRFYETKLDMPKSGYAFRKDLKG